MWSHLCKSTRNKNQAIGSRDAERWLCQKILFNLRHSGNKAANFQTFQPDSVVAHFSKIEMVLERVVSETFSWTFSSSISLKLILRMHLLSDLSLGEPILVNNTYAASRQEDIAGRSLMNWKTLFINGIHFISYPSSVFKYLFWRFQTDCVWVLFELLHNE